MKLIGLIIVLASITHSLFSAQTIRLKAFKGEKTINETLTTMTDGDELILEPGTYRESIKLDKGIFLHAGSMGQVIIDPSQGLESEWTALPEWSTNLFVLSIDKEVQGLMMDGKFIANLQESRCLVEGPLHWKNLLTKGMPLSGLEQVRAVCLWRKTENKLYLNLNGDNPNTHSFRIIVGSSRCLTFAGVKNSRVEGLIFRGGYYGVTFENQAENNILRNNSILSYENTGILITEGSSKNLIVSNYLTRGAYENWGSQFWDTTSLDRKKEYEIWQIHKRQGFWDRVGINLFRSGSGNEILSNHLYRTFDGIDIGDYATESLSKPLETPLANQKSVIAWNLIQESRDSGIELGTGAVEVKVHHNYLIRTHGGIRFKVPRLGPIYIHHNWLDDDRGFNIWFSMDSSPAEGYLYHNTVIGHAPGLAYSSFEKGYEKSLTPLWRVEKNVFICDKGFFSNLNKEPLSPNFKSSANLISGGDKVYDAGSPYEEGSKYLTFKLDPLTLSLPQDLSKEFTDDYTLERKSLKKNNSVLPEVDPLEPPGAGPLPPHFQNFRK